MKRAYIVGFLGLVLFALPGLAQAGLTTTVDQTPIVSPFPDICSGEDIAFPPGSTITVETTTWTDANGSTFVRVRQFPINLAGIGLNSGRPYRLLSAGGSFQFTAAAGVPFTETAVFVQLLVGRSVPTQVDLTLFHLSLDQNGNPTSSIEQMFERCVARK